MGQPSAPVPFCIIWKISWGVAQAIKVPEANAHLYTDRKHGWKVLIRDSDFPVAAYVAPPASSTPAQSNPRRHVDDAEDGA